jgi:hypothetical protein
MNSGSHSDNATIPTGLSLKAQGCVPRKRGRYPGYTIRNDPTPKWVATTTWINLLRHQSIDDRGATPLGLKSIVNVYPG